MTKQNTPTISSVLAQTAYQLQHAKIQNAYNEAILILRHALSVNTIFLITNQKHPLCPTIVSKIQQLTQERSRHVPLAYLTGKKNFWLSQFTVNKNTLIPRPETEFIVSLITTNKNNDGKIILDLGTGSGCILLSILQQLPNSYGIGTDICPKALEVAKINAKKLHLLNKCKLILHNWQQKTNPYPHYQYNIIVSNPPYIPTNKLKETPIPEIEHEPQQALDGGSDGLQHIKKIVELAYFLLENNGLLVMEHGNDQAKQAHEILQNKGFSKITHYKDLMNHYRVITAQR